MIRIVDSGNRRAVQALLSPERVRDAATERRVEEIVAAVRRHGDRALIRYAKELDGLSGPVEVSRDEMQRAAREVPAPVRAAMRAAARNIRSVARRQVRQVADFALGEGPDGEEADDPGDGAVADQPGAAPGDDQADRQDHEAEAGELIIMPANSPHAVTAAERFKMLLIMIRT